MGRTHNFPWTAISCARASTLILASRRHVTEPVPCPAYDTQYWSCCWALDWALGAHSSGRLTYLLLLSAQAQALRGRKRRSEDALRDSAKATDFSPGWHVASQSYRCSEWPLVGSPVNLPIYDSTLTEAMEPHIEVAVIIMGSVNSGMARKPKR